MNRFLLEDVMRNLAMLTIIGLFLSSCVALPQQRRQSMSVKERWDKRYDRKMYIYGKEPTTFLKQKIAMLNKGKALVLAMGEGRNAVYLAQNGFEVTGVDISEVAIEKCRALAEERGTTVKTIAADLTDYDMGKAQYDLITNFYYYDTRLFPRVIEALKPGGMFIFEHFSIDHLAYREQSRFGPRNPDYLVKPNTLLAHFKLLRILYYEDTIVELDEGMHKGTAAVIRFIAQKPE
jgi:tellurite methyltransferase